MRTVVRTMTWDGKLSIHYSLYENGDFLNISTIYIRDCNPRFHFTDGDLSVESSDESVIKKAVDNWLGMEAF